MPTIRDIARRAPTEAPPAKTSAHRARWSGGAPTPAEIEANRALLLPVFEAIADLYQDAHLADVDIVLPPGLRADGALFDSNACDEGLRIRIEEATVDRERRDARAEPPERDRSGDQVQGNASPLNVRVAGRHERSSGSAVSSLSTGRFYYLTFPLRPID